MRCQQVIKIGFLKSGLILSGEVQKSFNKLQQTSPKPLRRWDVAKPICKACDNIQPTNASDPKILKPLNLWYGYHQTHLEHRAIIVLKVYLATLCQQELQRVLMAIEGSFHQCRVASESREVRQGRSQRWFDYGVLTGLERILQDLWDLNRLRRLDGGRFGTDLIGRVAANPQNTNLYKNFNAAE